MYYEKTSSQSHSSELITTRVVGPTTQPQLSDITSIAWVDYFEGSTNPGWRKVISEGRNATSPARGLKRSVRYSRGNCAFEFYSGTQSSQPSPASYRFVGYNGRVVYCYPPSSPVYQTLLADTIARENFYSSVAEAQTSLEGGVLLAELGKTLRTLTSPAKALRSSLTNYLSDLRKTRNKIKKVKSESKRNTVLQESWLEYNLGIKPIIGDVEGAYKAVNHRNLRVKNAVPVFGSGVVAGDPWNERDFTFSNGLRIRWKSHQEDKAYVRYKGAMFNEPDGAHDRELDRWGLGAANFLPTVWELIPYSFVADYFSNIGKVVNAFARRRIVLGWGVRTQRETSISKTFDAVHDYDQIWPQLQVSAVFVPGSYEVEDVEFRRSRADTVSVPEFRMRLPRSLTQWANVAALASQGKRMRPF